MNIVMVILLFVLCNLGGIPIGEGPVAHPITEDEGQMIENEAFQIGSPLPHQTVDGQFLFKGKAKVFEAHFQYEIRDNDGNVLAKDFIIAAEGAPAWGSFEKTITLPEGSFSSLTLKIFVASAKDGSEMNVINIPLTVDP